MEITYETKINGTKANIILPDERAIDIEIQTLKNKINMQEQHELKCIKHSNIWAIIALISIFATIPTFICIKNIRNATIITTVLIIFATAAFIYATVYDNKNKVCTHEIQNTKLYLTYLKTLSEIHSLFIRGQVIEIVMKPKHRYLTYENENGIINHKNLRELNVDINDAESLLHGNINIDMDYKESTKIEKPLLRFQIDKMQIEYTKPYRKEN